MPDSIIQNGFGDAPPVADNPVDKIPAFTIGVASKIAQGVKATTMAQDVRMAAFAGQDPYEYFNSLADKAKEAETVNTQMDNDIAKTKADIAGIQPQKASDTNYQAALGAFHNLASNAPVAPMLQQLQLTDTDKLMMGFALLSGVSPNDAIGNFIKVKQGFTDQRNQLAQDQYKQDYNVWNQQLDASGTALTNERQVMNDTQSSLDRQYGDQLASLDRQANIAAQNGRAQEANNLRESHQASMLLQKKWEQQGIYTEQDRSDDIQRAIDAGLDPRTIIFPPVNVKTVGAASKEASTNLANAKFNFDVDKFNKEFGFKTKTQEEKVKQFNAEFERKVKQFEQTLGRQLNNDEWRQEYQRAMLAISGQRENRLGSGGDSGGGKAPSKPQGSKTDKQYRTEYEKIGRDITGIKAEMNATTDANELKKLAGKLANLTAQQSDLGNVIEWTDEELKAMGVAVGDMMGSFGLKPADPKKGSSGLTGNIGIPLSKSYGKGGDKSQYGTQKTQGKAKPVKSAPDAKKPQKQKTDGITFNPKPR